MQNKEEEEDVLKRERERHLDKRRMINQLLFAASDGS